MGKKQSESIWYFFCYGIFFASNQKKKKEEYPATSTQKGSDNLKKKNVRKENRNIRCKIDF